MSDFYRAEALFRGGARGPSFGLGQLISAEELEEQELEQKRARDIETRERKRGVARGRGRWGGGILGLLIGTA